MLLITILTMSTLLVGYLWGKHNGKVEGYQRALVDLPLVLREQSLEQGYCVLCSEQNRQSCFSDKMSPPI